VYEFHPVFIQPTDETERVWRYVDFTKFVSLLESKSLYFTRADKFEDPFEGSYPRINVEARNAIPAGLLASAVAGWTEMTERTAQSNRMWPKYTAINCWHLNNHESAAMWKLYIKSNEGVAIQSSYRKLRECFGKVEEVVNLGLVRYIDYDNDAIEHGNILTAFTCKRKSFEHEREVRALISRWPIFNNKLDFSRDTLKHGAAVAVDVDMLVEHVYIAPDAPDWFASLVESVIAVYGKGFPVVRSKLADRPLY
jgi:hypothetical protein